MLLVCLIAGVKSFDAQIVARRAWTKGTTQKPKKSCASKLLTPEMLLVCLIAGVKSFDAQIADGNHP